MRFIFRADASQDIGAGHVMRCSAVAEEFIARGEETIFIGSLSELDWLKQRVFNLGFTKVYESFEEFLPNAETDVLILDSYALKVNDQNLNPRKWFSIVAIVDSVTPQYKCQLRIHPGLDSEWDQNKEVPLLFGPKYIPLRKGINKIELRKERTSRKLSIIVSSGGTDAFGLVSTLATILNKTIFDFEANLFTNSTLPEGLDSRFKVIPLGSELDSIAETADLVFTTASTSALEFIAMGLPVGIVCAVENQESYYVILGKLKVAFQLGLKNSKGDWELDHRLIEESVSSSEFRQKLSTHSIQLIDLNGAKRIVDKIRSIC